MIKVLVVDDSAVVRKMMTIQLPKFKDIEVVGTAVDPYAAREKIIKLKPDVVTLDMEMPRMDGLSFLAKLMKHYPLPVVVLSSLTPENSETALKALELGAMDVICKPGGAHSVKDVYKKVARSIRGAASAQVKKNTVAGATPVAQLKHSKLLTSTTNKIIAIGASTGGTKAIEVVLKSLPATTPGTVIVQHMPATFTKSFAQRLNELCDMEVREAKENDHVVPGVALIAPGNFHMLLVRSGGTYMVKLKNGPRVHYQRPAVDVLFRSVAKNAGKNAVGVILTGMGADGAKGLFEMKNSGAHTFVQNEQTSVVFGMPKEAIKIGAADEVL
ncbi:MAG: chemotaxis response regulator protein-glutamate methylesterase, partial [Deltaproteobacteria bacterium]|nr:chemotaxis response regulator protein-glutamate methylesterase [Deltaproteobacteria bacterium]